MSLTTIDGGNLDTSINGGITNSNLFLGFSLQYLYHSGNIRHVYNTGFGYVDAKVWSGSGINLNSYPFYRIIPSGNISVNQLEYIDANPVYQVYSHNSGIVYFTNTGNITLSTQDGTQQTLYVTPPVNIISPEIRISGYPFNPSDHLLFCYNTNSQDSIDLKNYYFQTRPELATANVLGLTCNSARSGEMTDVLDYNNNIRDPIINYLYTCNKPIRYVTLLYDIGVRLTGFFDPNHSSSYLLTLLDPQQYPNQYNTGLSEANFISTYVSSGDQIGRATVSTSLKQYFEFKKNTNSLIQGVRSSNTLGIYTNDGEYNGNILYPAYNITDPINHTDTFISNVNSAKPWKRYSISEFRDTILITHITARNKQDVSGYIEKIAGGELYNNYYRRGNKPIKNFYLYESMVANNSGERSIQSFIDSGLNKGFQAKALTGVCSGINVKVFYPNYSLNGFADTFNWIKAPMVSGRDVAGLFHNGLHTSDVLFPLGLSEAMKGSYAYNNQARLSGNNWYVTFTNESFNGANFVNTGVIPHDITVGGHGTMFSWLRSGAYGGTGYENCPVGMIGQPNEMAGNVDIVPLFMTWFSGYPFIECAEISMGAAFGPYKIGDPLVVI